MGLTLNQICKKFAVNYIGDGDLILTHVCGLESITPGGIAYIMDPDITSALPTPGGVFDKRKKEITNLNVSSNNAVIVPKDSESIDGLNLIFSNDPLQLHVMLTGLLYNSPKISNELAVNANIGQNVKIGKNVTIDSNVTLYDDVQIGDHTIIRANVVIMEGAKVGNECILYPNITIREYCEIGSRVIIHANSVIGSDGFGYYQRSGKNLKIPQIGIVRIDDDVEIGSGVMIDRARFYETRIDKGCKLDNLIHIAHNVELGNDSLIAAQSGIAGSTKTGDHLMMGGQSGIKDNLEIGDNVTLLARTLVTSKTKNNQVVAGMPSRSIEKWRQMQAIISSIESWVERVRKLERLISKK